MFISYASADSAVAEGVCEVLERAGVACWIAPRDVTPGTFYASSIVHAIDNTKAIVLILSQHAQSSPHVLREVERAASKRHPIVSMRTDQAPLPADLQYFLNTSQWLDASGGDAARVMPKLLAAVKLAISKPAAVPGAAPASPAPPSSTTRPPNRTAIAAASLVGLLIAGFAIDRLWLSSRRAAPTTAPTLATSTPPTALAASSTPAHSVAVLPFTNMSGDPTQDYFSDGLSEELLNSLVAIRDLQVAARTSSFTFKGKDQNVPDIARKLHVGAVLEGSVRKDGNRVRITAQLIDASTGFHLWSQTYDRDLKNVLTLQTEIATAVTKALKATLLADAASSIEIGGTRDPAAFDAYLRGKNLGRRALNKENDLAMVALFSEAVRLDPKFAKAHVEAAELQIEYAGNYAPAFEIPSWIGRARENAEKALTLAPELGEAHVAMALIWERGYLELRRAQGEYERALALSPNDADVLTRSGRFFVTMGRTDAGLSNIRRAIALDELNPLGYALLGFALSDAKKYHEANEAIDRSLQIDSNSSGMKHARGLNYLRLGEFDSARQSCESEQRDWQGRLCMAIAYEKLRRRTEAESERAALQAEFGTGAAYQLAEIYAQWGDIAKALEWLEAAYRLPDPGIITLRVDSLVDPLRKEPRFREIERKLNFPN